MTVALPLLEHPDPDALMEDVASLIHEAGNPFYDWFYDGASAARSAVVRNLSAPSSEVSAERVTVLLDSETLAGMFVALGGTALAGCRRAEAVAGLHEAGSSDEARSRLLARMAETRDLFAPVASEDFYLSKIGVVGLLRGHGYGGALLREYLTAGRRAGFRRFRLDVSADNELAVTLYRSAGFEVESRRESAGLSYVAMVRDESRVDPRGSSDLVETA